jgi:hypothetical protein
VAQEFNTRGILTVVELYPDDPVLPFRNLAEWVVSGTIGLHWVDGVPAFDADALLDLLDGAGRHRLVLDLILKFRGTLPDEKEFKSWVRKAGKWMKKYSHVQTVKLAEIPADADAEMKQSIAGYITSVLEVSRWSMRSISASLWAGHEDLRTVAADFGFITVDPDVEQPVVAVQKTGELADASRIAKDSAIPVYARLPMVPRFYSKGWFAFEVGKTLDAWVDRNAFREYRERPGWLEDPR